MAICLLTGVAAFIAARVAALLLAGVDNLNDAYEVRLKQWRLARVSTPGQSQLTPKRLGR